MNLSLRDRLDSRAFLNDELYLRATRAEHEAEQLRARVEELEAKARDEEERPE